MVKWQVEKILRPQKGESPFNSKNQVPPPPSYKLRVTNRGNSYFFNNRPIKSFKDFSTLNLSKIMTFPYQGVFSTSSRLAMSSLLLITQLHIYFSLTRISSSRDFLEFLDINFPEQGTAGFLWGISWWEYTRQKGLKRVKGNLSLSPK